MSRVRTGGRAEALAHLHKAHEFLNAAETAAESGWPNAAASNAVTAGTNAKDAVCFALSGRSVAADDHRAAVTELAALGTAGKKAATAFDRLLGMKGRAQYDRRDVSETDAKAALRRARTMLDEAEQLLSG
jgi:HEPN domain-containing protein